MKTVIFIFLAGLYFSSVPVSETKIVAELAGIEYYSKGICKDTSFVYVRVLYKVRGEKPDCLKMKHNFYNGITSTMPVTETDKKGNFVYGFCLKNTEIKEFTTVFISSEGAVSNKLFVKVDVPNADIISGTAPVTFKTK